MRRTYLLQKFERLQEFLQNELSRTSTYHAHKENMAHAGFLVEIALFSGILTISDWPPQWVPDFWNFTARQLAAIVVSIIWVAIHFFIRWQLRRRRWADLYYSVLNELAIKWISSPPTSTELSPFIELPATALKAKIFRIFDHLVVCSSAKIFSDDALPKYPKAIAENLKEQEGKKAIIGEHIVTLGSWFIYFLIIMRTLYGKVITMVVTIVLD